MTTYLLRASHGNEYELQNYYPIAEKHDIHLVTSHHPLTDTLLPTHKLWSPTDLPEFPFRRQLFNRLFGGEQWLVGLNKLISGYGERQSDLNHLVIHTAETYTPYTHQAIELKKRGVINKLICTCWETIPHNNEKFARLRHWKQEAFRFVDIFHTPTQRAKDALITEGVNPSKIKVIPYGIDLSRFADLQGLTLKVRKKPIVLTLARRVPEKGYQLWQQISRDLSHLAEFRWVSDAPYSQIPSILRGADIFFLPSQITPTWEEQYGMVLVEAMAAGLPIVTTTSGAIPEVIGKNAALLSNPLDLISIRTNLLTLIQNSHQRVSLSIKSLQYAKKQFDSLSVAKHLVNLYQKLYNPPHAIS